MKLKNLAFFGVMGAILSVAGANAATGDNYLTTKGYVDARDAATLTAAANDATSKADAKVSSAATIGTSTSIAPNEKAVSDALSAKLDSSTASSTYATQTALTTGLSGKQDKIDTDHKLSASLVEGALTSTDLTGYATETYADNQASAAQTAAETTAAADATSKANAAQAAAEATAAADATSKANAAQAAAISAAATGAFNATTNYAADTIGAAIKGKQDTLQFDSTPTANSTNPVTSGGVATALAGKQATIDTNNKLSGTLISDGTVGTTQLSTAVNDALTAAGTALQSAGIQASSANSIVQYGANGLVISGTAAGDLATLNTVANAQVADNAAIAPSKLALSQSTCPTDRTCVLTYDKTGNTYVATPLTLDNDPAGAIPTGGSGNN